MYRLWEGAGFSRPGDLKCLAERAKPVEEQSGAVQCEACKRWFRSRGGLALGTSRLSAHKPKKSDPIPCSLLTEGHVTKYGSGTTRQDKTRQDV